MCIRDRRTILTGAFILHPLSLPRVLAFTHIYMFCPLTPTGIHISHNKCLVHVELLEMRRGARFISHLFRQCLHPHPLHFTSASTSQVLPLTLRSFSQALTLSHEFSASYFRRRLPSHIHTSMQLALSPLPSREVAGASMVGSSLGSEWLPVIDGHAGLLIHFS